MMEKFRAYRIDQEDEIRIHFIAIGVCKNTWTTQMNDFQNSKLKFVNTKFI